MALTLERSIYSFSLWITPILHSPHPTLLFGEALLSVVDVFIIRDKLCPFRNSKAKGKSHILSVGWGVLLKRPSAF